MTTIILRQGESARVELADTDGSFEVTYGLNELTVSADMPGSHLGGEGTIYREVFDGCTCSEVAAEARPDRRCPEHGDHSDHSVAAFAAEGPRFHAARVSRECCEVRGRGDRLLATFHGPNAEVAADAWAAVLEGPNPMVAGVYDQLVRHFQPRG